MQKKIFFFPLIICALATSICNAKNFENHEQIKNSIKETTPTHVGPFNPFTGMITKPRVRLRL